ncbi:MAG: hypothetical protein F6J95_017750 [Leptolyngbya sp. SIO1E4]|nr:hypothetical protein [Leptolyngbya sp. SIO1E4]
MFQPTHWLVSRSRKIPVIVQSRGDKSLVFTEKEWEQTTSPAFELHSKLGIFCRGVRVLGYELEPVTSTPLAAQVTPVEAQ